MLIDPSIDSLLEKVDNKYALVILTAARARQLRELLLSTGLDDNNETHPKMLEEVSIALGEINENMIDFSFLDNYMEETRKIIAENKQKKVREEKE